MRGVMAGAILLMVVAVGSVRGWAAQEPATAQRYYLVTNDHNTHANSATVFELNPQTRALTQLKVLETGGVASGETNYGAVEQSISQSLNCIFVADGLTGDIAAFSRSTNYAKTGNYSDSRLLGALGMQLALSGHNSALYAAYVETKNIGTWTVNADCSLTLANVAPLANSTNSIGVTPDGGTVLVSYTQPFQADAFSVSGTKLTERGPYAAGAQLIGLDVTSDSKTVLFAEINYPVSVETWSITAAGLSNHHTFSNIGDGNPAENLWLSPGGAAGHGCLYLANNGGDTITTATFDESGPTITYDGMYVAPILFSTTGGIQTMTNSGAGGKLYVAQTPYYLGVMNVTNAASCALSSASSVKDSQAGGLVSISAYPPR